MFKGMLVVLVHIMSFLCNVQLPVTATCKQSRKLLKMDLVNLIEAVQLSTVDVDDGHQLLRAVVLSNDDGHDDLAFAIAITGDVPRELLHILN